MDVEDVVRQFIRERREVMEDPFGPPAVAVEVECLHCSERYWSSAMVVRGGRWCCPTEGCDGAGFGFDIHEVRE